MAHRVAKAQGAPVCQRSIASHATGSPFVQLVTIGRASTIVFALSIAQALPLYVSPSLMTPRCWPQKFAMSEGTPAPEPFTLSTSGRLNWGTELVALGKIWCEW